MGRPAALHQKFNSCLRAAAAYCLGLLAAKLIRLVLARITSRFFLPASNGNELIPSVTFICYRLLGLQTIWLRS